MTETPTRPNVEYGDPTVATDGEILRTVVGSGVHGIAIDGTDDLDLMGVFIEPISRVVGTDPPMDHYISRTQPEGARSGPGDVDLVSYSLRKYVRLAAKGNPTALLPLWAPEEAVVTCTEAGRRLRGMRHLFMSQQAVERFLGYMHSQHERMLGLSKRNVPNRPELIEKYGWDVKYGAHALRLAYQGRQIAQSGVLSLPMPPREREHVLAVKRGEVPRPEVSASITELEERTRVLLASGRTGLPAEPVWEAINAFMVDAHLRAWGYPGR